MGSKKDILIVTIVGLLILLGLFALMVYLPYKSASIKTEPRTVDQLTEAEKQDLQEKRLGFHPDFGVVARAMSFITESTATSTPLEKCYSEADATYFDEWSLLCEDYYKENDYFRYDNYSKCMEYATTSGAKSYYNPYTMIKPIRYNTPESCKKTFLDQNVWPSNCRLPDNRGGKATDRWSEDRERCDALYKN